LAKILTPSLPDPVPNDPTIRKLALLSQLAVFRDIIPTYRIRQLTDKEKTETVSQMVARTREWEQGLVIVYQTYLRSLEAELKGAALRSYLDTIYSCYGLAEAKSELANIALQCICTLAVQCTHFNFSVNIMSCIVAQLSKKTWDRVRDVLRCPCCAVLVLISAPIPVVGPVPGRAHQSISCRPHRRAVAGDRAALESYDKGETVQRQS